MFKLLKNVELYTPEYAGKQDILIAFDKIAQISESIDTSMSLQAEIRDCSDMFAFPGFIDQHVHITGGGGEQGPKSIIGPLDAAELIKAGITTVVGILGDDGVGKSMQGLLMKARSLDADGLTAYTYTGNYGVPPVTITGRVLTDIAIIDKVIGAGEIAISDFRSSYPTRDELAKLAHEAVTGGMLGRKAGVVHLHVGDGKSGLQPLVDLLEATDFPVSMFVPTHLNRNKNLFEQALQYHSNGGSIDLTAGENTDDGISVPECLSRLINMGTGLENVTVSSDGNGSGAGDSQTEVGSVMALFNDFRTAVMDNGLPLPQVLKTVTENVARVLKLYPAKGRIAVGSDADILMVGKASLMPEMLISRGNILLEGGNVISIPN
ncbi:MAG: beta-aspartyl-peptidase [Clostridiaceae bacterium]|nr:beta-aspartyl-peptidase [Clostridiaceae bacterium]